MLLSITVCLGVIIATTLAIIGRSVQQQPTRYDKLEAEWRIQPEEYMTRLQKLADQVKQHGAAIFIGSTYFSQVYLIGTTIEPTRRMFLVMVTAAGRKILLVPRMERVHLSDMPGFDEIRYYNEHPAPKGKRWIDSLSALVSKDSLIIVDGKEVAYDLKNEGYGNVILNPLPQKNAMVKSPHELRIIREACRLGDQCIRKVMKTMHIGAPGVVLFKAGDAVKTAMTKLIGFDPMLSSVLAGAWIAPSADPHDIPGLGRLVTRNGPHIAAAFVKAYGYMIEVEQLFFCDEPNTTQRQRYEQLMEIRAFVFSLLRPGVTVSEIDRQTRQFVLDRFGVESEHGVGHGIGLLSFHNLPYITEVDEEDDVVLEPNMVITIEPGRYFQTSEDPNPEASGSYRHSKVVLITEDGYEILSGLSEKIEDNIVSSFKPLTWIKSGLLKVVLRMY